MPWQPSSPAAQQPEHPTAVTDPIHWTIAACDRRLAQHRAALEAGADPVLVTGWLNEVQVERAAAVAALEQTGARRETTPPRLTRQEINDTVEALGGFLAILRKADPADKAEIYRQLGLRLSYNHETQVVSAEASPRSLVDLVAVSEEGLEPLPQPLPQHRSLRPSTNRPEVSACRSWATVAMVIGLRERHRDRRPEHQRGRSGPPFQLQPAARAAAGRHCAGIDCCPSAGGVLGASGGGGTAAGSTGARAGRDGGSGAGVDGAISPAVHTAPVTARLALAAPASPGRPVDTRRELSQSSTASMTTVIAMTARGNSRTIKITLRIPHSTDEILGS